MQEDVEWSWTEQHDLAVDIIKKLITQSPVLKYFDPKLETKISADASKTGLGAVLLQKHDNDRFPIAYASRAMTSSEINYAQIEKETLAIVFGTDRFHDYLYGKKFTVESDHKQFLQSQLVKHHPEYKGSFCVYKGMTLMSNLLLENICI